MFLQVSQTAWYLIGATGLFIVLFFSFIIFFVKVRQKQDRMMQQELKVKSEYEEELLRTQLEIQEQTLKNISQEIHDNVGQVLSLAKLNLNTRDIGKAELLQEKINDTLNQVSKAINDLRDLSKSFNADNIAAIGLIKAIESEMAMINKTGFLETEFLVTGLVHKLDSQKELILFRIVQETLHNIIKHALAKRVKISIVYTDSTIELQIADDGKGFDLSPLNQEGKTNFGLGIRNMHNRAQLIGANFSMQSNIGIGTEVLIVLPFERYLTT